MPSTITDKSGNGVTGTPSGVSFDSTWKAFSFDGSGDVITNTRSGYTGSGVYTASTWVNVRKEAAGITFPAVFQYGNGQSSTTDTAIGLAFRPDGAIRQFIYGNSDLDVYGHKQYNTWTHCTAIYMLSSSETKITLYINGEEVGFNSTSTGAAIGATPHLCIGAQANNSDSPLSSTYLHGSVANFRLFNRALTGDEIWQLYAYQKDYFQVSPDVVTFKGGRLGIGTSEPRAVLDVRGSFHAPGTVVQVVTKPVVGQYAYSGNATDVELTALTTSFTPKFGDSLVLVQVYLSYEADYNAVIFIRANANDIPTNQGRTYGQQEGVIPVSFDNNVGSTPNSSTFVVHHILNGETSVQYKVYYRNNTTTGTIKLNQGYSAVDEKGMCYIVITEIAQ
jgi:hypothetical protein